MQVGLGLGLGLDLDAESCDCSNPPTPILKKASFSY